MTLLQTLFPLSESQRELNARKTVVVGMSGGVDSSVTALIVKHLGFKTIGVFMKNWEGSEEECSAEADWKDARRVAGQLDIPVYSVNFSSEYAQEVFSHFLAEYKQGHTPNPDILCNREIKFKVFLDYVEKLGADMLATGHYCQTEEGMLLKGADPLKDQSYFLHAIKKSALEKTLFPLGHLTKKVVRSLALEANLVTKNKKDSTGICFIGERDFKTFLSQYIESSKGDFVNLEGALLGRHDGACFYTLGQRKGLGVGGPGEPWFVVKKNLERNQVVLAQGEFHPALYSDGLNATEETWIAEAPPMPVRCKAKIRYRQTDVDCVVYREEGKLKVHFDAPQRAITPRQSVVFYEGEVCLGGAMIEGAWESYFDLGRSLPEGLGSNPLHSPEPADATALEGRSLDLI